MPYAEKKSYVKGVTSSTSVVLAPAVHTRCCYCADVCVWSRSGSSHSGRHGMVREGGSSIRTLLRWLGISCEIHVFVLTLLKSPMGREWQLQATIQLEHFCSSDVVGHGQQTPKFDKYQGKTKLHSRRDLDTVMKP